MISKTFALFTYRRANRQRRHRLSPANNSSPKINLTERSYRWWCTYDGTTTDGRSCAFLAYRRHANHLHTSPRTGAETPQPSHFRAVDGLLATVFLQGVIEILHRCRVPIAIIAACLLAISSSALAASPSQAADVLWYGKAPPGWGGVVTNMKLMAPNVGWAERAGRLYWTTDNGTHWKDITPPGDGRRASIFFLNPSTGWITINHTEPKPDEFESDIAATTDAGETWSRTTISLPPKEYGISDMPYTGGAGTVAFADPMHGWMTVGFGGETPNSWSSFLLVTSDSGRTWSRAANAPELSETQLLLVTPNQGWLFGVDHDTNRRLYVTRDGARSWQEVARNP